jgi:hypothetical protein
MAALFKYLLGVAVTLPAVIILCAMMISEIYVGFASLPEAAATRSPRWNIERLKAEPDTKHIARGSLSPIYPAAPGKELLGKPVYAASVKRLNVRQALQLFPRQLYPRGEQDSIYPPQSLSYTELPPSQPRTRIIFGHGIY